MGLRPAPDTYRALGTSRNRLIYRKTKTFGTEQVPFHPCPAMGPRTAGGAGAPSSRTSPHHEFTNAQEAGPRLQNQGAALN